MILQVKAAAAAPVQSVRPFNWHWTTTTATTTTTRKITDKNGSSSSHMACLWRLQNVVNTNCLQRYKRRHSVSPSNAVPAHCPVHSTDGLLLSLLVYHQLNIALSIFYFWTQHIFNLCPLIHWSIDNGCFACYQTPQQSGSIVPVDRTCGMVVLRTAYEHIHVVPHNHYTIDVLYLPSPSSARQTGDNNKLSGASNRYTVLQYQFRTGACQSMQLSLAPAFTATGMNYVASVYMLDWTW